MLCQKAVLLEGMGQGENLHDSEHENSFLNYPSDKQSRLIPSPSH